MEKTINTVKKLEAVKEYQESFVDLSWDLDGSILVLNEQ